MPTNLNALIRYKQIDRCLNNPYTECSIMKLRELCSEAIEEYRGVNRLISERTIREDIKIMRSDILGFNAPIIFEDGVYKYSIPHFTLFNRSILNTRLLLEVFYILKKEQEVLNNDKIDDVLDKISKVLGKPIESSDRIKYSSIRPEHYRNMTADFIKNSFNIEELDDDIYSEDSRNFMGNNGNYTTNNNGCYSIYDEYVIDWGDIISLLK